jgi:peptidoglycan/xylan/chitin deacetylase (PgdA/CDA1 family)
VYSAAVAFGVVYIAVINPTLFRALAIGVAFVCAGAGPVHAAECSGPADALGTSRVLYVDPAEHPFVGSIQYRETLPLADHEVVVTFDDGPASPYTAQVLDILRSECVLATFFAVGGMAHNGAALLKRAYDEGHSIGSDSQTHPLNLPHLPPEAAWHDMEQGELTVSQALGPGRVIAPFMRFPALNRTSDLEVRAIAAGLMVWSTDIYADDWMRIAPEEVVRRPLERLQRAGKGIVLFHDIHARTVAALPEFLKGLNAGGYKVVHVVPAGAQPKTETAAADWHALDRALLAQPGHIQPVHHRY